MTNTRLATCALALSLAAIFAGSQAQAQNLHLPTPPMVHDWKAPEPVMCFRDPAQARAWTDAAFDSLQSINHDRQAVDAYVNRLKIAVVNAPEAMRPDLEQQIADYGRARLDLDDQYRFVEKTIANYREVGYCDPEPPRRVARLAVPVEIGFSFFEGRRVRVFDHRDHTHTVIREEGGRHTEERLPNVSRR